jgi:PBP1b-binding outer membrane lipoprotein LpoB|tara:strand:- start:1028 stop:1159 length:132 start_codon:yes stop_codon:yes gene_type:complete
MIKKISLVLILCLFVVSCGKKGDPEYKNSSKKEKIQKILVKKT